MSSMIMKRNISFLLAAAGVFFFAVSGCGRKPSDTKADENKKFPQERAVTDQPIAAFQTKLLDLAFETAGLIPKDPFIKDRCGAQQNVVTACLALDQPQRSVRYADQIDNWQRGLCYAQTAYYLAQKGYGAEQIAKGLELAEKIAALDHGQKWRSDRIKAVVSQTYTVLGKKDKADAYGQNLEDSESGKMLETCITDDRERSFNASVEKLDSAIALGNFDLTKGALHGYTLLFKAFYDQPEKRDLAETKIRESWQKSPLDIRINLLVTLSGFAHEHGDQAKALELVKDAKTILDTFQCPLEQYLPLRASLIEMQHKAGEAQQAGIDAEKLNTLYDKNAQAIIDIYRADTLYPLAEAYQAMGDAKMSLAVYKKAVEAAVSNPNLKPRAEDLSAICCSMAVHAVEPDLELWERLGRITDELSKIQ